LNGYASKAFGLDGEARENEHHVSRPSTWFKSSIWLAMAGHLGGCVELRWAGDSTIGVPCSRLRVP
jgi:hypothetical protein